jgi:ABC-type amino acid transport substrate-binding protein
VRDVNLSPGRPKKLNPLGERFRDLYLDPSLQPDDIRKILGISRSTFYNYEKELGSPTLRVAIANSSELPLHMAIKKPGSPHECFDLAIACALGKELGARLKLIPCSFHKLAVEGAVKSKTVDFGFSSLSWTAARAQEFVFSETYNPIITPSGNLFRLKGGLLGHRKPRLGVPLRTVHADHAQTHLRQDYEIRFFRTVDLTLRALTAGHIDFVVLHPDWLALFDPAPEVEPVGPTLFYKSFTGIIFHRESEIWVPKVNQALESLHSRRDLEKKWYAVRSAFPSS